MVAYTKASGFSHRAARPHAHSSKIHAHQTGQTGSATAQRAHSSRARAAASLAARAGSDRPRAHTAPRLHSPARSRGLTRYIDHPAPSSGPLRALPLLDGTLTRRRPKAIPRHLAHGTDPTQHDATRLAASPAPCARGTPARTHAYMHSGGQGRLSAAPHLTLGKATCASSSA